MEGERRVVCITCTRSVLRDRNRHHLTRDYLEDNPGFTEYVMERININEMALNQVQYMCHRCWVAGRRQQARFEQEQNQELGNPEQPTMQPTSVPTYRRVANTARHCLFRGCINQELHRVSSFIKVLLLVDYSVYVPENARICAHHINSNDWSSLYENGETIFTPDQLKDMIDTLRAAYKHKTNIDFDNALQLGKHFDFETEVRSPTPDTTHTEDSDEWTEDKWTAEEIEREQFSAPPEPRLNIENPENKAPLEYFKALQLGKHFDFETEVRSPTPDTTHTEDSDVWTEDKWTAEEIEREQFPAPPEPRLNIENPENKAPLDYFKDDWQYGQIGASNYTSQPIHMVSCTGYTCIKVLLILKLGAKDM
ncbi:uncharacterized protein LOC123876056 [Maniola jurtina]|uniref:uncharacterized protein LOC123876056 n=1 Tax=Maniola jurtina TaxID=191418 RepID=UPI001E687FBD|nr:uncharacterized protein LOC123876056 [Maniola jurtina]